MIVHHLLICVFFNLELEYLEALYVCCLLLMGCINCFLVHVVVLVSGLIEWVVRKHMNADPSC